VLVTSTAAASAVRGKLARPVRSISANSDAAAATAATATHARATGGSARRESQ
jgi:hypothetical protein